MRSALENLLQDPKSPDEATAGTDPVAASTEAVTTPPQAIAGVPTQPESSPDLATAAGGAFPVTAGADATTTPSRSTPANSTARPPSNTKPHTQNQDLHDAAVKLLVQLGRDKKEKERDAQAVNKGYNQRRKDATEKLRPVLTKIWAAFERGETVGGCAGPKEWCKRVGTITYRRCRQIITGESQTKKVKSLHLLKELLDLISTASPTEVVERARETAERIKYVPKGWKHGKAVKPVPKPEEGQSASQGTASGLRPAMQAPQVSSRGTPRNENGSKVAYEPMAGGPKVLEVAIPGEFPSDPSRLKYYVCAGEKAHPHPTLEEAKAHCDRLLAQHAQEAMPKPDASPAESMEKLKKLEEMQPLHPAAEALEKTLAAMGGDCPECERDYTEA